MTEQEQGIFPFDLDGVQVVGEDEILVGGRRYRAAVGEIPGVVSVQGNPLRGIPETPLPVVGERWESRTPWGPELQWESRAALAPSYGPAWEGLPYIPEPAYVREQVARRRAGLPVAQRARHARPTPSRLAGLGFHARPDCCQGSRGEPCRVLLAEARAE